MICKNQTLALNLYAAKPILLQAPPVQCHLCICIFMSVPYRNMSLTNHDQLSNLLGVYHDQGYNHMLPAEAATISLIFPNAHSIVECSQSCHRLCGLSFHSIYIRNVLLEK
jgi:hypothetical protein